MPLVSGYLMNPSGPCVATGGHTTRFHSASAVNCSSTVIGSTQTDVYGHYSILLYRGKYRISVLNPNGQQCCFATPDPLNVGTFALTVNIYATCVICQGSSKAMRAYLYDPARLPGSAEDILRIVRGLDRAKYHWEFIAGFGFCDDDESCEREGVGLTIWDKGDFGPPEELSAALLQPETGEGGCCCCGE